MNDQVQSVLKQLSVFQRIGIIFAAIGSVAAIAVLVMFASKPDYTPAFTGLAPADAMAIEGALRSANIAFQVADAGTTIMVPVEALGDAKIAASTSGVSTGASDTKGWDLFNNTQFGASEFDQQVTYQRALEGELTKTIQAMDGVSSARVAVVLAQKGVLTTDDTPASASVVLAMSGAKTPSNGLVRAIVNTVASSVSGLAADNVVVTDDAGHVLAGAADSADTAAAQAKDLVEQQAEAKIMALIDSALGAGHASIAVSADVDTSKVEQQITTYAPAGSDPPVSIHNIYEQYGSGASAAACGIPGTNSNVPGLPSYPGVCTSNTSTATAAPTAAPTAAASSSPGASPTPKASAAATAAPTAEGDSTASGGYVHQETTVNYSVSQTVQHIVTAPGVVKRLSVAVLVDQAALGTLKTDTLKASIAAAIGADTTRGDVIAVDAVTFAAKASAAPGAASGAASGAAAAASPDMMKSVGDMSGTILGAIFGLFMLILFWLNTRALGRRADETVMDLGSVPSGGNYLPSPARSNAPAIGAPEAPPAEMPSSTPQARIQERLRMVADERPDALVGLMHGWLREEDRRR